MSEGIVASRYHLSERLGAGSQGDVWRAWDEVARCEVAVKLFSAAGLGRSTNEISALRRLRLPGVPQLREAGSEDGLCHLVMDFVEGERFPGRGASPAVVCERVFRLLEVLDGVHRMGIVHADLKPDHVRVGPDGNVTLVDFGLACEAGAGVPRLGTPLYMAPELVEQDTPSPRSDLFAVGTMWYEAVCGHPPWPEQAGARPFKRLSAMQSGPAVPPSHLGVLLPPDAEVLLMGLLSLGPADRPVSAAEAASRLERALLGERTPIALPPGPIVDRPSLVAVFEGPELLHHLPGDAADAVLAATQGEREAVARTLAHWELAGIAIRRGARLRITRHGLSTARWTSLRRTRVWPAAQLTRRLNPAFQQLLGFVSLTAPACTSELLARILPLQVDQIEAQLRVLADLGQVELCPDGTTLDRSGASALVGWGPVQRRHAHERIAAALPMGSPGRLEHLLAADALGRAAEEAEYLASRLADGGFLFEAIALTEQAISWVRSQGDWVRDAELITTLLPFVLSTESLGPLRLAAYLLASSPVHPRRGALEVLVSTAIATLDGDPSGVERVLALEPFSAEYLEIWRVATAVRGAALRVLGAHEAVIDGLRPWAGEAEERRAYLAGWEGQLLYRKGDMEGAAKLHYRAAAGKCRPHARLSSLLNAAAALLDGGQASAASSVAREGEEVAASLRLTLYEARAVTLQREAAYRLGQDGGHLPELVEAALALDEPNRAGVLLFAEARAAWRRGEPAALDLACLAAAHLHQGRHRSAAFLADGLVFLLRGDRSADPRLVEEVRECPLPELVRAQIWGLLADGLADPVSARREVIPVTVARSAAERAMRQEILSLDEVVSRLDRAITTRPATATAVAPKE